MEESSRFKKIYLIRHAKSSWNSPSVRDFDRPLNERGLSDAPVMGRRIADQQISVDLIISSEANRAQTTAKLIAKEIDYDEKQIQLTKAIYHASIPEMIQLINQISDQHQTIVLFGHNPTFTELAEYLTDEAYSTLPTCGIVGIQTNVDSWSLVSGGCGEQIWFDYPKSS